MKTKSLFIYLLFTALASSFCCQNSCWAQALLVRGLGKVSKIVNGDTIPLKNGDKLQIHDTIRTGESSLAIVQLPPHTTMKILANSQLQLTSLMKDSQEANLEEGGILVQFKKIIDSNKKESVPLKIRAKNASMGVRGTKFFVSNFKNNIWMCVKEGNVEVKKADESKQVGAGLGMNISEKSPLENPKEYAWTKNIIWNFDAKNMDIKEGQIPGPDYTDPLDFDYD